MTTSPDVVVVGGGVVGAAVAYYLSLEGARVQLLDRDALGSGCSFHGTGLFVGLNTHDLPPAAFPIILAGRRLMRSLYPQLVEDTGVDPLYHELPEILVALDEREVEQRRENMRWVTRHGIVARWLDRDEVFAAEPLIGSDVMGAAFEDAVGQVDAYRLTLAFAAAAEKRGCTVRQREAVGLERTGGRVTGVVTTSERIHCDKVVLAMGAWSGPASEWTGFPVPVKPFKGQTLRLRYPGTPPTAFISYLDIGGVVPRRDGTLSFGSSYEDADDSEPTEKFKLDVLSGGLTVMPWLEEAEVVHHLAGPRPVTPDDLPMIGPVPGWDGLHLATGHGKHGIQLAPITGKLVADLILRGATPEPVPMEAYLPERFAGYTPERAG